MIGTIRKHQTWLWAVIITATIISFVWYFGPSSRLNNERRGAANFGSINGERITQEDYMNGLREVELQFFFFQSRGNWPTEEAKRMGWDQQQEIYKLLLLIQKQRQMGIHISSEIAAQTGRNLLNQLAEKQELTPQILLK